MKQIEDPSFSIWLRRKNVLPACQSNPPTSRMRRPVLSTFRLCVISVKVHMHISGILYPPTFKPNEKEKKKKTLHFKSQKGSSQFAYSIMYSSRLGCETGRAIKVILHVHYFTANGYNVSHKMSPTIDRRTFFDFMRTNFIATRISPFFFLGWIL